MPKPKLLVSGSEGRMGRVLCKALAEEYALFTADISMQNPNGMNTFRADLSRYEEAQHLFSTVNPDFVLHLAGSRMHGSTWEMLLKNNIVASRNIFECAREADVKKIVIASSNHVTGGYEGIPPTLHEQARPRMISPNDPIRQDSDYGATKAFIEALARQYFECHGIHAIILRIGAFRENDNPLEDKTGRWLKTWISHRDLIQLVKKSLESSKAFGIYYGVSNNSGRFWDISNAVEDLGYKPQDNAALLKQK